MAKCILIVLMALSLTNCNQNNDLVPVTKKTPNRIVGTWKMIYAESIENDSLRLKELTHTEFIKIINGSHFSFFNQHKTNTEAYYSGAGTYTLNGNKYNETLTFTTVNTIRNHEFPFTIDIKGDTLIQYGNEIVEAAGIDRKIIEK